MRSGKSFLMMNSWPHTSMASLSNAVMLSCDGFTHVFSPIQLIIKRSKLCFLPAVLVLMRRRVIIATIRNLGSCPCPRCLIQLSCVHNMGKAQDMKQRETLARVDDENRRRKVAMAREIIYQKNYAVGNDAVESLLQGQSLVPTTVSAILFTYTEWSQLCYRIHSLASFLHWALISFPCLSLISCMSSSWVSGKLCLFIFSGYCLLPITP